MHFRTMQLQLFQKQCFKHESQSLNIQVNVHSQLPIYFQIKLLFFVFLYIKPTYLIKSTNPCVFSQVWSESPLGTRGFKSRMCPPYPHACLKRRLKWGAVIYSLSR